jgi:HSP20 family protein
MSQIAVEKINGDGTQSSVFTKMKSLTEQIRQRAFDIFQHRSANDGNDVDDWFKAENELIWAPESDLVEKEGKFEMQVAVPGFDAKDVEVTALPDAVVVCADSSHQHDTSNGNVRFCEFGERTLFRRFDLPAPINVDKVTADLDKGILKLTAAKADKPAETKTAGAA